MRKASGEYIMVMHHDDWFYSVDALGKLVERLSAGASDLVFARSFNINVDGEIVSTNDPSVAAIRSLSRDIRSLFYANLIGAPSAVLFKNKGIYFDVRLKWLVDLEFYIRYLGKGRPAYVRDAIVAIGVSPSQATQSCLGNLEVEIGENLLVYRTLRRSLVTLFSDFRHFNSLFNRFDISKKELSDFNPEPIIRSFFILYYALRIGKTALKAILRRN
jgi:hypothetical protein